MLSVNYRSGVLHSSNTLEQMGIQECDLVIKEVLHIILTELDPLKTHKWDTASFSWMVSSILCVYVNYSPELEINLHIHSLPHNKAKHNFHVRLLQKNWLKCPSFTNQWHSKHESTATCATVRVPGALLSVVACSCFRQKDAGQNCNTKIYNKPTENAAKFTYLETRLTNQNCTDREIKWKLNSGNTHYYSSQNLLSSYFLSTNIKTKTHRTTILFVLSGCEC
jgi:hypothetical protein